MGISESRKGIDGVALPQPSKQRVITALRKQALAPILVTFGLAVIIQNLLLEVFTETGIGTMVRRNRA